MLRLGTELKNDDKFWRKSMKPCTFVKLKQQMTTIEGLPFKVAMIFHVIS